MLYLGTAQSGVMKEEDCRSNWVFRVVEESNRAIIPNTHHYRFWNG